MWLGLRIKFSSDYYVDFIVCVCYLPLVNSVHTNSPEFFHASDIFAVFKKKQM